MIRAMPEGLTWNELTAITSIALRAKGCRGWSIGCFNADLDPAGRDAERIVAYLGTKELWLSADATGGNE
jgi:hypothetical protein